MATANGMPQREKVTFLPNVPVQVALKWPDGKIVSGNYGDQMMYSLTDGRICFLDLDVANKISALELKPGEPFGICKLWNGDKKQKVRWDVYRTGERYVPDEEAPEPPPDATIQIERKPPVPIIGASVPPRVATTPAPLAQVNGNGTSNPHVVVTDGRPKTRLEDALKTVVQALHSTNEYSKSIGYAMPQFGADEICRMVNTLLIGSGRQ